jgi:hypothetical protein
VTAARKKDVDCFAYGCSSAPVEGKDFCAKDLKRLPAELWDRAMVREAIVLLAKKDGYLTPDPLPVRSRTIMNL